jgi:hypothetical protein
VHQTGNKAVLVPPGCASTVPHEAGKNPRITRQLSKENLYIHCALEFLYISTTRVQVRLLGPCFKTGQWERRQHASQPCVWRQEPSKEQLLVRGRTAARRPITKCHLLPVRARTECRHMVGNTRRSQSHPSDSSSTGSTTLPEGKSDEAPSK